MNRICGIVVLLGILLGSNLMASHRFEEDAERWLLQDIKKAVDNIRAGKIEIEKSILDPDALGYLKPFGVKLDDAIILVRRSVNTIIFGQQYARLKNEEDLLIKEQYKNDLLNLLAVSRIYLKEVKQIKIDAMNVEFQENQDDEVFGDRELYEKFMMTSRKFN